MGSAVLVFVGLVAIYALVAARLEYFYITGPIIFVVLGVILGPEGTSSVQVATTSGVVRVITSTALVLLLFADASTVELPACAATPARRCASSSWDCR